MSDQATKKATYDDLFGIPENMTGEIIDGELIVHPRPSRKHISAASSLRFESDQPISLERAALVVGSSWQHRRSKYLWLVDPHNMTVEVYRLDSGAFDPVGVYGGKDKARMDPFIELEIDLGSLWLDG